ncbi:uncharacterized protein LOC111054463 [Nilaparvata lugens]|uniref:uncharacterized protein LOC111054463 n=1 Tax=Nilaparvata lugens TaxID=108931 RepID=UPI00193C8CA2|nr:uncharacterized protein LOC111054463 [Nilaparvata lugens]
MGAVACIESRAAFTRLGLGVPAGLLTVIAASSSIQTSRGFGGYRSSSCGEGSLLRFLGPNFVLAVVLTLLWALACGLQFLLLVQALLTVKHSRDSHTSFLVAVIQLVLSTLTLLAVLLVLRIDCIYDPD